MARHRIAEHAVSPIALDRSEHKLFGLASDSNLFNSFAARRLAKYTARRIVTVRLMHIGVDDGSTHLWSTVNLSGGAK